MGLPTLAALCCWALLAAVGAQDGATACRAGGSCEVDEESVLLSLRPAAVQRHEDAQGARANVTAEADAAVAAEADVAVAAEADADVAAEADADIAAEADADVAAEADAAIAAEADVAVAAEADVDVAVEADASVTADADAAVAAEADADVAAEADADLAAEAEADVAAEADADADEEAEADVTAEADADVAAEADADAIAEADAETTEEVGVNATVDADEEADSGAAGEEDVASSGCGPKSLTRAEIDLTLKLHNQLRKAVGVGPLRWNNKLQCQAQKWADKCLFKHSDSYGSPIGAGENLASGSDVELSIFMWFSEYAFFPPRTSLNTLMTKGAGHYTAMTWPSTKEIGCGKCTGKVFVCQYTNSVPNMLGGRGPPPFEGKASQFRRAGVDVDKMKRMFSRFARWGGNSVAKGAKAALKRLR